jgi:DHA2 family multidrug resistance protein
MSALEVDDVPARQGIQAREPLVTADTQPEPIVPFKIWLAVVGSALGSFLAILNIQIVNAALTDIQGAIGAGMDDGGWISTSYLVTEIIVIPLTGWLTRVFSMRLYLLTTTVLFLLFSVACAQAHNLGEMLLWRAFAGFTGGALIPMAFTIIITMLPKAKQSIGLALLMISATSAPAIGPMIGGWLNENYGWQYIFYVNLVPGTAMLAVLWLSLEPTPTQLKLLKQGDWTGMISVAVGLGTLQIVLEEGHKEDWFGSLFIVRLSIISLVALSLFVWIELTTQRPFLNLRLLLLRNFGLGNLAQFLIGVALYGSIFILPRYLSQIQGYNAEQIGAVLAWVGLPQLLLLPFVPKLMKKIDGRVLAGVGLAIFAASNFLAINLTMNFGGDQFLWINIIRSLGQAIILTPLSAIATAGIGVENAGSASGIFNMTRNLGGAIGIAVLQTFLTRREQFHSSILMDSVSLFNEATRGKIAKLTQYFLEHGVTDPALAQHKAVAAISQTVRQQAFIMAYGDTFLLIGVTLILSLIAVLCLRKTEPAGRAARNDQHGG